MLGGIEKMKQVVEDLESNRWSETLCIDGVGWSRNDRRRSIAVEQMKAFGTCTCSTKFMLHNAQVDDSVDHAVSSSLSKKDDLRSLTLCKLSNKDNQAYIVPEEAFHSTAMECLILAHVSLDLESCMGLSRMIRLSTSLKKMSLDSVEVDRAGWQLLMDFLTHSSSLRFLKLKRIKMDYVTTFDALKRNKSITNLTLEDVGLSALNAIELAAMIQQNQTVSHLSLQKNEINAQAMEILSSQGFLYNSTLQRLYLSGNPLGDEGAIPAAQMLAGCHSLSKLCLAVTDMTSTGTDVIANALSGNRGLRSLSLDGNDVGDSCAETFLCSLQRNVTLQSITGHHNPRKESTKAKVWKEADLLLRANKAGRSALKDTDSRIHHAPFLLARATGRGDSDVLFHFLTHTMGILAADNATKTNDLKKEQTLEAPTKQHHTLHAEDASLKRLTTAPVDQRPVCPPSA